MNLFTIADLHLPLGADKPMDIFGGWDNYVERIENNWKKLVNKDDTVVIGGDISWAISLAEAKADFEFINSLPGKKIILKGNHDYWWGTANKINEFLSENSFDTIEILHNNCYSDGNFAICGTRGWIYDGTGEKDQKVILREASRLETSIKFAIINNVLFERFNYLVDSFSIETQLIKECLNQCCINFIEVFFQRSDEHATHIN